MGSFMGRANQYKQLVMALYCKLPTIGKQIPTFPLYYQEFEPQTSEVGGEGIKTMTSLAPLTDPRYWSGR